MPGAGSGGLASDGYAGNILWDVDTWMLPVFQTFHPDIARRVVDYRAARAAEDAAFKAAFKAFKAMGS